MTSSSSLPSGSLIVASAPSTPLTKSGTTTSTNIVGDTTTVVTTITITTIFKHAGKGPTSVNKRVYEDGAEVGSAKRTKIDFRPSVPDVHQVTIPSTSSSAGVRSDTSTSSAALTPLKTPQAYSFSIEQERHGVIDLNRREFEVDSNQEYEDLRKDNKILLSIGVTRTVKTLDCKVCPDIDFKAIKQKILETVNNKHLTHHPNRLVCVPTNRELSDATTPRKNGMRVGHKYSLMLRTKLGPPCLVCIERNLKRMLTETDKTELSNEYKHLRDMVNGVVDNFIDRTKSDTGI